MFGEKLNIMAKMEWNFKFVKVGHMYNHYKCPLITLVISGQFPKNIQISNWGYVGDQFANNEMTLVHKFISAN